MEILLREFSTPFGTTPFDLIHDEDYLPAIKKAIEIAKEEIRKIKENPEPPTFKNTVEALESSGSTLEKIACIFFNLNTAETNPRIQEIAKEISPLLSEYKNDILLDEVLFERINTVHDQMLEDLSVEQETLLKKTYRSFFKNGANLDQEDKLKLREIDKHLSQLSLQFSENILRDINDYELIINNLEDIDGLPESEIETAAQLAKEKGYKNAWAFTLNYPSYIPFMTYVKNRELRKELHHAYSSKGFKKNKNDNRNWVLEISKLRYQRARLLGYATHAEYVLEERMADQPQKVIDFLNELLQFAKPIAKEELKDLENYAIELDGLEQLKKWDYAYYQEKLKKEKFDIDNKTLKPYFKLEDVVEGIFKVAHKLYGFSFTINNEIQVYHPEVNAYEVKDRSGNHMAVFYTDFFPRVGKKSGAWMTSYRGQKIEGSINIRPHISIVCNFTRPTATEPSLLTFEEVLTLFHEFGHALHGISANGTYESLSGTNVYWDFVELPSQIMENWVMEKECLDLFASHYQTGEKIPAALISKIKAASNFMEGYKTTRQISLALLDMAWHHVDPMAIRDIEAYENDVFTSTKLFEDIAGTNMSSQFLHIFAGGYSAGYYSYKWAEVLDADAFEFFKEKGIFNQEVAHSFYENVLSQGGKEHPLVLYKRFRGKEPSLIPLLKRAGLINKKEAENLVFKSY